MTTDVLPRVFASNPERVTSFVPTPEQIAGALDHLKEEEVTAQMRSVDGRKELYEQLLAKSEQLSAQHPDFHPETLAQQLDAAGESLAANQQFTESMHSAEKQGLMSKAWSAIKSFPRKHPVVTGLLGIAAVAGGVGGGLYLAGYWESLMATLGVSKILGIAEVAGDLAPIVPDLPPMPGGGPYEFPLPVVPPDVPPIMPH